MIRVDRPLRVWRIVATLALVTIWLGIAPLPAVAQPPPSILHEFPSTGARNPGGLVEAADGNFYGATQFGGIANRGTVFRMRPDGMVTILHDFRGNVGGDPTSGAFPSTPLMQASDGNLYGVTGAGGTRACGTVYRVTPAGVVSTVHQFEGLEVGDGCDPNGPLVEASDGHLYGTTAIGGRFQGGTIFRLTLDGTVAVMHSFFRDNDAERPGGGLVQAADGHLYGTTLNGGLGSIGTIYRFTLDGTLTIVHRFDGTAGTQPGGTLISGADGHLYGVTSNSASAPGRYAIFRTTLDGQVTWLHTFTGGAGGSKGAITVRAPDGNFYGSSQDGGAEGLGFLFRLSPAGVFTTLYTFSGIAQGVTPGILTLARDGMFYGVTLAGGNVSQSGTIFRFPGSGAITTLHVFGMSGPDGKVPVGALIQGPTGEVYGTTTGGGTLGYGIVFKCALDGGVMTVLHEFAGGAGGAAPAAGLFRDSDGTLYGTTLMGGAADRGIVFRLSPDGAFTVLHAFTGGADGGLPASSLVRAIDGQLYGTTLTGGNGGYGTVFKLTSGGLVTLHSFSGADGATPIGGVIQASDGALYGTTLAGGEPGVGTIYRLTLAGVATVRHVFAGPDGALPLGGVHQARDGQFYGTTTAGGSGNRGVVFRMGGNGSFSVLHAFSGADGANPSAAVMQGRDGYLYGTTLAGGASDQGTIFKVSLTGVLSTIHGFTGADGSRPFSPLLESNLGHNQLLGTTLGGGRTTEQAGVLYVQFIVSCEDQVGLRFSAGTLFLDFTIWTHVNSQWEVWIVSAAGVTPLWSVPVPGASETASFTVPISGVGSAGTIGVFTRLSAGLAGPTCGDWRTIDTGAIVKQ
jgi:uncharacterized repeat protein (TIGR03803 family)